MLTRPAGRGIAEVGMDSLVPDLQRRLVVVLAKNYAVAPNAYVADTNGSPMSLDPEGREYENTQM